MNTVITIAISIVVIIDFLRIDKKTKRMICIYSTIVILAIISSFLNKHHFFAIGPFEIIIDKMQPLTDWVFDLFS